MLIVSAPLLGVAGFDRGAFLCWGDGGHIGIEIESCETHCETPSFSEDFSIYAGCREDDDSCGACIDIPLPSGWATKRIVRRFGGSELRRITLCAAYCPESIVNGREPAGQYSRYPRPGAGDESITSLRTIVLLI